MQLPRDIARPKKWNAMDARQKALWIYDLAQYSVGTKADWVQIVATMIQGGEIEAHMNPDGTLYEC